VRDITDAVGVDVALVSYHFGGKRELFTALFQRRAKTLNAERLVMLEEVRSAARPGIPALEAIVNAFTFPMLERSARGGPGWKSYFALVAQVNNSPEWGPVLMTEHFDPIVARFIEVLCEALPGCSKREVFWGISSSPAPSRSRSRKPVASTSSRAASANPRISTACTSVWPPSLLRDFGRCVNLRRRRTRRGARRPPSDPRLPAAEPASAARPSVPSPCIREVTPYLRFNDR